MNKLDTEPQILDHVLGLIATWEAELTALSPKLPVEHQKEITHLAAGMQQIRYASSHLRSMIARKQKAASQAAE